jgi:hypothetical protein
MSVCEDYGMSNDKILPSQMTVYEIYTSQQTAAEIMAGKSRNTIGHVLRVRVINGSAVILEFELGVIIRPLGK